MTTIGVDTNVLAYAEGANDPERKTIARDVLDRLSGQDIVMPVQVAGELFRVLTGRMRKSPASAREIVQAWQGVFRAQGTTPSVLAAALDLATDQQLRIWDAIIMAAAAEAGCRLLLSEDLAHGFSWRGLTIVDPFRPEPHRLLAAALGG